MNSKSTKSSQSSKKKLIVKIIAFTGIMAALSSVLRFLEFPLFFIAPDFLKFDFSNLPALIISFVFGPFYGLAVVAIKNLIYLTVTQTAGIGELADFIFGGIFVFSAGIIYKLNPSRKTALIGMVSGTIIMTVSAAFLNYFFLIPFFANLFIAAPITMREKIDIIVGAFNKIFPFIDNLLKAVCFSVVPFNLIKGVIISLITFFVYKRISAIFKKG